MTPEAASSAAPADGLREAADELYGLLPAEFTAARNRLAAAAGKASDKELSRRIKALPKPTSAAWLVNMLTRRRPEDTAGVLELGAALREAQEDLDPREMRRLSSERQRLLRAMARDARQLADELGHPVSGAVAAEAEQTLWAAMTDAEAAAAVAGGRLIRSLTASGWGSVDLEGAVALPELGSAADAGGFASGGQARGGAGTASGGGNRTAADGRKERASARSAEEKRRRAERARALRSARTELTAAEQAATDADRDFTAQQAEVDDLTTERDAVADDLEDLREQVRRLEQELTGLDRRAAALERRRDVARRAARAANRAVDRARRRVQELDDSPG